MNELSNHLVVVPIILPLAAAGIILLLEERQRELRTTIAFATTAALLLVSLTLLFAASGAGPDQGAAVVYALGDWPAPFGIVLVADRLSAMMLALTSILGLATLLFALARWDRAGPRFHALFLILLVGVNGAFLTGDLFNLFVFFEVLLAASYGLALHGSGTQRVRAGLHYIAINLVASSLFLIGVSIIYGVTGTLNMADLAARIPMIPDNSRMMFEIGCAVLGIAFLVKAGMWPLGLWLPATYSASSAPAAAMFAILTKVGVYVVLRLSLLLFGEDAGPSAGFGAQWLAIGGLFSIALGTIGVLAARAKSRIAGFCVLVSSGTVLAVIGIGGEAALAGALYYLVSSTLALSAFFLLIELLNRARGTTAPAEEGPPIFSDEFRDPYEDSAEVGLIIPAAIALMSGGFILCAILLAGVPPLSGFIGKFAIMSGVLPLEGPVPAVSWALVAILTVSSLAILVALLRVGIDVLWVPADTPTPKVQAVEFVAIAALLGATIVLTVEGGFAMGYASSTVTWLNTPQDYVHAVMGALPPLAEAAP